MIVKNEAPRLEGCVRPLLPLVEEVVIVDTGSTDNTIEVARRLGARVQRREWRDSFAQARNASLAAARGEWILVVDADERVDPPNRRKLARLLAGLGATKVDAYRLRVLNWWCEGAQRDLAKYVLFRNRLEIRYQGRVHETVRHSLARIAARTADAGVVLHHRGDLRTLEEALRKDLEYARLGTGSASTMLDQLFGAPEAPLQPGSVSAVLEWGSGALPSLGRRIVERAREVARQR
jgi:glycosyltransferase involved in cell wall biosynthesis